MAAYVSSPPSYWVHKKSQVHQKYFLVDDPGTQSIVAGICKSTWKSRLVGKGKDAKNLDHLDVQITGVKRVENPDVFNSYNEKRRAFLNRERPCATIKKIPKRLAGFNKVNRIPDINEYYLFHGTKKNDAINIAETGFKTRFADKDNMFGKAIYFTDRFMKAYQYSDDKENREPLGTELTVLMARVLLGETYKCKKDDDAKVTSPPCFEHGIACSCRPDRRHDSVESTGFRFREFAVYEGIQCYPEYIITYIRRGRQDKPRQEELSEAISEVNRQPKRRSKREKPTVTWQQALESISVKYDGHPQVIDLVRLDIFCQKTKTAPPVFEFHDNRQAQRWTCDCKISFPVETTTAGRGRRKKIAKRLAAEQIWKELRNLLKTNP